MILMLIMVLLYIVGEWTLKKAQQFYTAGDGDNFNKWKTINTVIIVLAWVLPLLISYITYTIINNM